MRSFAAMPALLTALLSAVAHAEPIERIRPSDGIASIRISTELGETAIHITFAEDMIPLGGGHAGFPVRLEGHGGCDWGWRGPRTVTCLLGQDDYLPMAERYALVIDKGLTAISGTAIPPFRLDFETDRPTITYSNIDWDGPTSPVIYVHANVPVSARELERRITLEPLERAGQRVPSVRVAVRPDPDPVEYLSEDRQFAIRPRSALAPDTAYVIRVGGGLAGVDSGLAGTAHDAGSFRTHADFGFLGVGCGPHADRSYWDRHPVRIPPQPECAPEQPVSLLFSAEPEIRGLYGILTEAGLAPRIAGTLETHPLPLEHPDLTHYQARKMIYGLRLSGFPAGESNSVELPAAIKDRFARALEPATATFPTRNFVPAFLSYPGLQVIGSGSGEGVAFTTVNTDAIAANLHRDQPPGVLSLTLDTVSPGVNERGEAVLGIEEELGKPWGVLVGEIAITPRALANKHVLRGFPLQYARSAGAILSPWDVIVAAKGLGLRQRHSIWVSELETGEAVSGATVQLLERPGDESETGMSLAAAYRAGKVLGTARTDAHGFAEIVPTPGAPDDVYPSMVRVTKGDTVVVLPIDAWQFMHRVSEAPLYSRSVHHDRPWGYVGEGAVITWGITDKPLYRSGENVRIKGYVRIRDDNRLVLPGRSKDWKLHCVAYPNDLCAGRSVELDEYGAFEATVRLPEAATDGEYGVSVDAGSGGLPALSFRVATYKPKPHKVGLTLERHRVLGDHPVRIDASAEYFAGGALENADGQVFIESRVESPPVPDALLEDYWFGSKYTYWSRHEGARSVVDAGFDEHGRLTGSFPLPPDSPESGTATVIVGARHDGAGWAYSNPETVEYVQQPYLLGLRQGREAARRGEAYEAGIILVDLRDQGDEGLYVKQSMEYPDDSYRTRTPRPPEVADECTVEVRTLETASCDLIPTRTGRALVRARLMRGDEEILQVQRDISVYSSAQMRWYGKGADQVRLQPTTGTLKVNDVAELVVDVPYDNASVLFALHRNIVFEQWREILPGGENRIRIPLTERHAPGFTITAIARPVGSGGGTATGSLPVKVRSAAAVPGLAVRPDREIYKAGGQVRLTLNSTAAGKTQIAVAVIDEAVLNLVPGVDRLFDPQGPGFAGLLEVWSRFRWWQLGRAMDAGDLSGGDPAASGAGDLAASASLANLSVSAQRQAAAIPGDDEQSLRHEFVEAAYFNPAVVTTEGGEAEVSFTVPDNLGKWRVVAIGADREGQLFAGSTSFDVALPLEVRADLPDRLIAGDSIQPSAAVLSRKPDVSTVTLSVEVDPGNGEASAESRTSSLSSMHAFSLSTAVRRVSGHEVRLTATARDNEDVDGLIITAPVREPLESRSWTSTAPLSSGSKFVQPIELPANVLETSPRLRVTLEKSVIGDLSQAFHYMSQARHDSWEQILSRAVVAAYANAWEDAGPYRISKIEMRDRLLQGSNFQATSGGMSHFEPRDDRADDYLSAYTLLALSWIESRGFDIPEYRWHLVNYLTQRANLGLRDRNTWYGAQETPADRDMPVILAALSSLPFGAAHQGDRHLQYLRSKVDGFDVHGLTYALIAATNLDAPRELRADLSGRLQARLVETFDRIEISGGDYRFGSRNELYCSVLDALQGSGDFAPEPRKLAKLVRGGYEFRDSNSGFGNTHANAVCIAALTEYASTYEAPSGRLSARVTAPGLEPMPLQLDIHEDTGSSESLPLPLSERRSEVGISFTSGTSGYASVNIRFDVDLSKEVEQSHGYRIRRSYSVYQEDGWKQLDAGIGVVQGEWVRVDLDVITPVVRRFVAMADPTPAGLEPVDPSLSPAIPGDATERSRGWHAFDRQALSNVASRFYAEWLPAGEHRVSYYAQAKFAGDFMALPARVESMYSDGVFATTAPTTLHVQPASPGR